MPTITDMFVVLGMIGLRIGVPVLMMAGLVYMLKRLDRRWEAEAHEYAAKQATEQATVRPATEERPATPKRVPAPEPQLPFLPPPADKTQRPQPGMSVAAAPVVRSAKTMSGPEQAKCAAAQNGDVPCWQARFDAEGSIPEACVNCESFQRYPLM